MNIRLKTQKRTFVIDEKGVCQAVYLDSRSSPEVGHLAVGRKFLGSVANRFSRDEIPHDPPRVGHYLAFAISGGKKEGRLCSEATFVSVEGQVDPPVSVRPPPPQPPKPRPSRKMTPMSVN